MITKTTTKNQNEHWSLLMQKAQEGDRKSYSILLGEIQKIIRRFVQARIRNQSAVDDVVQDILLGIHNARHTFDPSRAFSPWMFTIAKYKYVDHVRKWSRSEKHEVSGEGLLENLIAIEDDSVESELKEELRSAINKLPSKQRTAVTLLKLRGLSIKEVAAETGMSEPAVKVTAHRGYKKLKIMLSGRV